MNSTGSRLMKNIERLHHILNTACPSKNNLVNNRSFAGRLYSSSSTSTENRKAMEGMEIKDMKLVPCTQSKYVVPGRVTFKQNGRQRKWDYVKVHDSVSILIYNKTRDAFVLVKQFRPAPYLNINSKMLKEEVSDIENKTSSERDFKTLAPFDMGVTYELCAGIVDQKRSLAEIAQSEIEEETGYIVPLDNIKQIFRHTATGHSGNMGTAFYAEVTDEMKKAKGGGVQDSGEFIDLHYLPRTEAKDFALDERYVKPSSFIAAMMWYFTNQK